MKRGLNILAVLLLLTGTVWTLQGANILPGSFMTGSLFWLAMGLLFLAVGIALLVRNRASGGGAGE